MNPKLRVLLYALCMLLCACTAPDIHFADNSVLRTEDDLSSQRISCFLEDADGYLWVGTERGLDRYNGYEYRQYLSSPADSTSLVSDIITTLHQDRRGRIWVGTMNGLCLLQEDETFVRVPGDPLQGMTSQILELPDGRIVVNNVRQLFEYDEASGRLELLIGDFGGPQTFRNYCTVGKDGRFWSIIPGMARCYNINTLEPVASVPLGVESYCAGEMPDGSIWIFDDNGGIALNPANLSLSALPEQVRDLKSVHQVLVSGSEVLLNTPTDIFCYDGRRILPSHSFPYEISVQERGRATRLFLDRGARLWTADGRNGLSVHKRNQSFFNTDQSLFTHIGGFPVVSGFQDSRGRQWFLSDGNALHVYDPGKGFTDKLDISEFHRFASQQLAQDLSVDFQGRVWLRMDGRLLEMEYRAGTEERFGALALKKIHDEFDGQVMAVEIAPDGTVWAGAGLQGLYRLEGASFTRVPFPEGVTFGFFRIKALSDGSLAVGSYQSNPVLFNPENGQVETLPVWDNPSVSSDFIYCFLETPDGLWTGSRSSGIFRYHRDTKQLDRFPSLPLKGATDIEEDRFGNLWAASENGLFRLTADGALIGAYHKEDGLGGNQFMYHTALKLANGHLVFGGQHGLTVVNPDIYQPSISRNLVFEDLRIGGKLVVPSRQSGLPAPLFQKPEVTLGHRDNHFSVTFLDLNPGGEENAHYYYRLEGYDSDWVDLGSTRQAFFNNIPAGRYRVRVRIARSDRQTVEAEESFPLRILPAPWASWWAKMLYAVAIAIALWQAWAVRRRFARERQAKEQEAFEKEQERRVNDMNMRFFANISHEFRTPLTMISGPVSLLEKTDYLKPQEHKLVDTIKWNAARMLKLVNQLMDFNKLENDALRLKVSRQDLVALTEQTLAMFRITMAEKHITLQTEGLEDTLPAVADPDKVDKVLSNLLSNAVKYTPEGGTIGLKLDTDGEKITFEVSDNGPGIPEDQLERIFERYFQVEDHHNYGTGIGLYFARCLMQLHHGSIHAENLPQGVKFIAEFPAKDIYKPEEHVEVQQMQQVLFPVGENAEATTQEHENTILLVDDDSGIVNYLKLLLSPSYNILYAYNAEGALNQLEEHKPDLILSDVAMPGMDGYELCRRIKADAEICHLPVILVTAKTTTDEQIAGLNTGADAYVTKPFDPEYLQALIRSQLENRARIRGIIANATTTEEIQEAEADALSEQDKALMDRLYAIMEEELSNEELNINKFTEMMYMSRTKLYYKIKGLTGETPNAFFKKYKLNRAAEMLKSGNHNISEVSDLTGFSSPTVFTRNFRAQFGMTPTEYLSQTKKR